MEVRFNDPNLFIGKNFETMDVQTQILIETLPPQVTKGSIDSKIAAGIDMAGNLILIILACTLVLGLFT